MPRTFRLSARLPFLVFLTLIAVACAEPEAPDAPVAAGGELAPAQLRLADLERMIEVAHDKFVSLAEAMPEEDLPWRPMDGVRSVSEVFVHIAADNYFVPALMGWEAPPETGVTSDPGTFQAYQSRTMSKDEMVEAVDASFDFFRTSMTASVEELDREVVLGNSPTTVGDVWIRATTHLHEHLGQSIAYARANEVVPPWSR